MSSFIADIITAGSEIEMEDLQSKMVDILKQSGHLRELVKENMELRHVQLLSLHTNNRLCTKATEIKDNINELQMRLDNQTKREIANLSDEMKDLVDSLKEASISLEIIEVLFDVDKHMTEMSREDNSHFVAAQHFKEASELITRETETLEFIEIVDKMQTKLIEMYLKLESSAIKAWEQSVCWKDDGQIIGNMGLTIINCSLTIQSTQDKLMAALDLYQKSDEQIKKFSQDLLKKAIIPSIDYKTTLDITVQKQTKIITLKSNLNEKSDFHEILSNLITILKFIRDSLDFDIGEYESMNSSEKSLSFISKIGMYTEEDMLNHLVECCLADAIPTKKANLPAYQEQVQNIINFQALLMEVGFLSKECKMLAAYCGNVEEQFRKNMIKTFVTRAREICRKPLHEMIKVELQLSKEEKLSTGDTMMKVDMFELSLCLKTNKLSPNLMQFPQCYISTSTDELVNLGREILKEMSCSGEYDSEMFSTVRDIFSYYYESVPKIHSKFLTDLPQQSALFYNNCWYLAHKLIKINEEFRELHSALKPIYPVTCFVDLARPLMLKGITVLDQQINRQTNELFNIIQQSGLSSLSDYEELPEATGKSIKQCLHMMSSLQSMWETILPCSIYCQVMGSLVSSWLQRIIQLVVATSDIRADIALCLVKVFSTIQEKVPAMFPDPTEVIIHVKHWSMFNELVLILSANLVKIRERWYDGKGPLALVFQPAEIRQLVRALFQVSDRRAALLARIK